MKLFGRTGGYYLFWTGFVYLAVSMYCVFVEPIASIELTQAVWCVILVLPFAIPPLGRYFNLNVEWDRKMFGSLFKSRNEREDDLMKDIKESAYVAPVDPVATPAECHYTVGTDSDGEVVLRIGGDGYVNTTLTMNEGATRQLIRMLEAALPLEEVEGEE